MVALSPEVEEVVEQIKLWPAENRIALARRVLETLDGALNLATAGFKGPPTQQVLGLWNPRSVSKNCAASLDWGVPGCSLEVVADLGAHRSRPFSARAHLMSPNLE